MRAVLTKVKHASVTIDGEVKGKIGKGFLILLGVAPDDTEEKCRKMADKLCSLRIFEDENDKINLSLDDVGPWKGGRCCYPAGRSTFITPLIWWSLRMTAARWFASEMKMLR